MKYLLDTNFLIALLDEGNDKHKDAMEIAYGFAGDSNFVIPSFVVAEMLVGTDQHETVFAFLDRLTDAFEGITSIDLRYIGQIKSELRKRLRANDCLVLAISSRTKAKVVTFDIKLQKAVGKQLL
ncbi:MAG: type II toxin-antitoxin system VapC family toxin [Candidatus Dojkabacteria bacterium]